MDIQVNRQNCEETVLQIKGFRPEWYISTIYVIVEIDHSGRKPLKCIYK